MEPTPTPMLFGCARGVGVTRGTRARRRGARQVRCGGDGGMGGAAGATAHRDNDAHDGDDQLDDGDDESEDDQREHRVLRCVVNDASSDAAVIGRVGAFARWRVSAGVARGFAP